MTYLKRRLLTALFTGWAAASGSAIFAQDIQPANWPHKGTATVDCTPCPKKVVVVPGTEVPSATTPPTTPPGTTPPSTTPPGASPFEDVLSGAVAQTQLASAERGPGYIDQAVPQSQFRFRFDSATGSNRPDRAEFFYPKCGCFRTAGLDPKASGPAGATAGSIGTNVDYREYRSYLELSPSERFSVFVDVPFRHVDIDFNNGTQQSFEGLGDIMTGFKYALIADAGTYLTFQLTGYLQTGSGGKGLGTDHYSIEPGFLLQKQVSDKCTVYGELKDWISIGGTDFAGNVLRYGIGASYLVYESTNLRIYPVVEFVAWSVLSGKELGPDGGVIDSAGTTIVNAKYGIRFGFGDPSCPGGILSRSDLYVGYGNALTSDRWYRDVLRVEYRVKF